MKTIPLSWKPDISDRDTWYNNRGRPLIFIRIQRITGGYLRLSNDSRYFNEEGGIPKWYASEYFKTLGAIEIGLTAGGEKVGAVGYLSNTTIEINNGEIDGEKFTDIYDLDQFINAKVDIYFVPEQCGDISIASSLRVYRGKIYNFIKDEYTGKVAFSAEAYSETQQKKIPHRVQTFNDLYATGYNCPEIFKNKVIPICFGTKYFKIITCDLPISTYKELRFFLGHPISNGISPNGVVVYWDRSKENFANIRSSLVTETKHSTWWAHDILISDATLLPENARGLIRLTPNSVTEDHGSCAGTKDKILDMDLEPEENPTVITTSPYIMHNALSASYQDIWTLTFLKEHFPLGVIYNLYLVFDLSYVGQDETPKGQWNFTVANIPGGSGGELPVGAFWLVLSNGSAGRGCFSVVEEYAPHTNWYRNRAEFITYLKLHGNADDLSADPTVTIQLKQLDTGSFTRSYQQHEFYIALLPITPTVDYYLKGEYGENTIQDAIDLIYLWYLNLDPDDYVVYSNFARNYNLDGQIYEEIESKIIFERWAKEFGLYIYEDEDGILRVIDINTKAADITITNNEMVIDKGGKLQMKITKDPRDVYSSFSIDYDIKIPTGKYDKTRYLDKDNHNFTVETTAPLQVLCRNAYDNFATEKKFVLQSDFIVDDETAEESLAKAIKYFTYKPYRIKFISTLKMVDLEIGDQIKFNTSALVSDKHFYLIKKRASYMFDKPVIEYELIESPWSS